MEYAYNSDHAVSYAMAIKRMKPNIGNAIRIPEKRRCNDDDTFSILESASWFDKRAVRDEVSQVTAKRPFNETDCSKLSTSTFSFFNDAFPDDLLNSIFTYVGDGSYRFMAGVSQKFRKKYQALYPKMQTYYTAHSIACTKMCFSELKSKTGKIHLFYVAAKEGNLEILTYLRFLDCPWDQWTPAVAAKNGRLDIIEWARANGCPWDGKTVSLAAKYGHVDVLQYAHENQLKWKFNFICEIAASNGQLAVLQWARAAKIRAPWSANTVSMAAGSGHMDIVQWGYEKGCPWNEWTCALAAKGGHLLLLQWIRSKGCPWNYKTCLFAANHGQLEVLKWARASGCPWNSEICIAAAENGHVEVLTWAQANGCPWDEATCAEAARNGHLDVLMFARSRGCPWNVETTANAASNSHLKVLEWACQNNCPCDYRICENAAKSGNLAVLKLATKLGCPRSENICAYAARYGHLNVLMYAKQNDYFWNAKTCANAAESGHLDVLTWAHENGCPWDKTTCDNAAKMGHLHILNYAHKNGCPWTKETCMYALENKYFELLIWACENGCPLGEDDQPMNVEPRPTAFLECVHISSQTGRGIVNIDGGKVILRNSAVADCAATGVYIGGPGSHAIIENSDVIRNGVGNRIRRGIARGHSGIYLEQGIAGIRNSNVSSNTLTGISVVSPENAFLTLQGSTLMNNGTYQLELPPPGSLSRQRCVNENNVMAVRGVANLRSGLTLTEPPNMLQQQQPTTFQQPVHFHIEAAQFDPNM